MTNEYPQSMKTNIVGTNKKYLNEALLMSTHVSVETFSQATLNVVFCFMKHEKKKKNTTQQGGPFQLFAGPFWLLALFQVFYNTLLWLLFVNNLMYLFDYF